MKSGNRNFLEPSGPLQACNRTVYQGQMDTRYPKYVNLFTLICTIERLQWHSFAKKIAIVETDTALIQEPWVCGD